jgi:hypothetical protein
MYFKEKRRQGKRRGRPADPTVAQHAGAQYVEPDSANPIDSRALLQPGTAGADSN